MTAYPVSGKRKSVDICRAFVDGCGGRIQAGAERLLDGPAVFYGVDDSNVHIWEQVLLERREFWYIDNAYFEESRQRYFRVTKNATQHSGRGQSNEQRFLALGIKVDPWRGDGEHILVCPQSDHFMHVIARRPGNWTADVLARLSSAREIRVRTWDRDKAKLAATLEQDLAGAYCLVTWSSAAAITAILSGVPAVVESDDCAAWPLAASTVDALEWPTVEQRRQWAGLLADNQWTLDEMRSGSTWRALH